MKVVPALEYHSFSVPGISFRSLKQKRKKNRFRFESSKKIEVRGEESFGKIKEERPSST